MSAAIALQILRCLAPPKPELEPLANRSDDLIEVIGDILAPPCRDVNGRPPCAHTSAALEHPSGRRPGTPLDVAWRRFLDAYEAHYDAETRSRYLDGEDRERAHYAAMREGVAAAIEGETL